MEATKSTFSDIFKDFNELTLSPELFLEAAVEQAEGFKIISKKLYDITAEANSLTKLKTKSLLKLLVDGFHEEQIWQQIELQNKSAITHFRNALSKINGDTLVFGVECKNIVQTKTELAPNESSDAESSEGNDDLYNEAPDSNDENFVLSKKSELGNDEDLDEEMEAEENDQALQKRCKIKETDKSTSNRSKAERLGKKTKHFKSEVDDQFFKLSKLEQFLRLEDLKEERSKDEDLNMSDDEQEIDLFQDIPSDDGDEEDESEEEEMPDKKSSRNLMYEDFFDPPESGDESVIGGERASESRNQSDLSHGENAFSDENGGLETDDEDKILQIEPPSNNDTKSNSKTPFDLQQEKVKQQIEEYEENMLKPAAWHLTGEVDALKRPKDALLHLQTDFEMNAKPVVIQDKELCEKLENMLKMTIKNKAYSDGVKQYKTNNEIIAYKKEAVLDQKKSQKSLAQEYEDMYLKKQYVQEEEEDPKHKEIKKMMDSLFPELHALFTHIPKPAVPDIKIVSNLPAIAVEEVAPTSVSDVTLLAPEEVKKRSGLIKGQTERTDVDRKRERRKKKGFQKMKQKKREKENSSEHPTSSKAQKREKVDMLRKLKQHRNTKIAKVSGEKIKSSKDFFEKLQDTVTAKIHKVQGNKKKRYFSK